jgi:lipopolysaccharide biosynthesis glycosyltransferase
MTKLIFITAFINIGYISMLSILVKSLYYYGNIDKNTDILIYTSSEFKVIIENSQFYSDKIKIFINDNINTVDLACKARLDLFEYDNIDNYDKILYLDTDIIIQKNINCIFDLIEENKIYAIHDGFIDNDPNDYYGGQTLFKNEIDKFTDKSAFNTGVMLFNNCIEIKNLFNIIKNHITLDTSAKFNDQPYFVYNAKKYNLVNNILLNDYVELTDSYPKTNKHILHISGGPGIFINKLKIMLIYFNNMIKNTRWNFK